MKILNDRYTVDGHNGEWRVDIYGDTHLGTKSVNESQIKKDVAETKASGNYWVHVGDVIDGIIKGDKRFSDFYKRNLADWAWSAYQDSTLIEAQWNRFEELFSPIKEQCIVVLSGDGKHNEMGDVSDCFKNTIGRMGIRGGYPSCFYTPTFTRGGSTSKKTCQIVFHHGWFAGRTSSAKVLNLQKALNTFPQAVACVVGHGHDKVEARLNTLIVENSKITERIRRAAMTGSYLRTYAQDTVGYGEIRGFPPVAIGKITLVLRPFHHDPEKRVEFENM